MQQSAKRPSAGKKERSPTQTLCDANGRSASRSVDSASALTLIETVDVSKGYSGSTPVASKVFEVLWRARIDTLAS